MSSKRRRHGPSDDETEVIANDTMDRAQELSDVLSGRDNQKILRELRVKKRRLGKTAREVAMDEAKLRRHEKPSNLQDSNTTPTPQLVPEPKSLPTPDNSSDVDASFDDEIYSDVRAIVELDLENEDKLDHGPPYRYGEY